MSTRNFSARPSTSTSRLKQDYLRLKRDPVPYISAEPLPANILEWHYVVRGPEDTPYHGGFYHGHLVFPLEFPFKPPAIYMRTPNGRFKTNTRLCLSISDFHPDSWNPAWSVATILTGLLSFMLESTPTYGSTESSSSERRELARKSIACNLRSEVFCELFPDIAQEMWMILGYDETPPAGTQPVSIVGQVQEYRRCAPGPNGEVSRKWTSQNVAFHKARPDAANQAAEPADGAGGGGGGGVPTDHPLVGPRRMADPDSWQYLCSNVAVLAGFAIFAYFANYVIKNLNQE